ncbi:LamG-like jellyroll fold domain-containing protein [Kordia antarctica]|uniref:LamG-like jellyroll fold domain-containing protein n=1 Tax=Kordia antarctica TaxID=1218801 RepID=UPI0013572829|nr:LamG-like jellyroll fold domain-containing protein [Kordia antarctica]
MFVILYSCNSDEDVGIIPSNIEFDIIGCDELATGMVVGTITSNISTPITFSLELGDDENTFNIDPVTGEVSVSTTLNVSISDLEGTYNYTFSTLDSNGAPLETFLVTINVSTEVSDISSGLLGYYPFSGNSLDESGNNNDGTVFGATLTSDGSGAENNAYHFSQGNYISIENVDAFDDLATFTLSAWVNPDFLSLHNSIISKVTPNRDFNLQLTNIGVDAQFAYLNGAIYYRAWFDDYALDLNVWTHVLSTWDGTNWRIYLNGELVKISPDYVDIEPLWTGGYMTIGNLSPQFASTSENFYGKIDEVRIYNRVLTSCEVNYLYEQYPIN